MNKGYGIALALGFLFVAAPAWAGSGLNFGGGLNISSSNEEDSAGVSLSSRIGFNAGVGIELWLNDMISILPELSLETRGEKFEGSGTELGVTFSTEGTVKMMYLYVPVYALFTIPMNMGKIHLFAGPVPGFLLSAKVTGEATALGQTEKIDEDFKDEMKVMDFGVELGGGFEFNVGDAGAIFIRPSYYLGLLETADVDDAEGSKHRNIKLKIGYKYNLAK